MVIKLLPEQISALWDYIRAGIYSTPSPFSITSPKVLREILKNMLLGTIQCWAVVEKDENSTKFYGFVLTNIAEDFMTNSRFLNIFDIYAYRQFTPEMWEEGMKRLKDFAKVNNCDKITAYTTYPNIVNIAKKLGFDTNCSFIMVEVK